MESASVKLTPATAQDLLSRFSDFFDAVVKRTEARRDSEAWIAEVELDAKAVDGTWWTVTFRAPDVIEYLFKRGNVAYEVLSLGLKIHVADADCVLDLSPSSELSTIDDLPSSDQFIRAPEVSWQAQPVRGHS
jgi:hypothetical protein